MIKNDVKAKYNLIFIFFGWVLLPSIFYNALSILMSKYMLEWSGSAYFETGYLLFFLVPFIYIPIAMIFVWKKANNHQVTQGQKSWVLMLKVFMLLWVGSLIYYAGSYFLFRTADKFSPEDLVELSTSLNASLPQESAPYVLMTKATFKNSRLIFQYQITNKLKSELHLKTFVIGFKDALKNEVCHSKFTQKVLNSAFGVDYEYIDKNKSEIYIFNFNKEDCP